MRSFDPRKVGRLECVTWVSYYRREWPNFLRAAVALVRQAFGMSWPRSLRGAWLILRANQLWAPYPDNDPEGARRNMRRFYALIARSHGESLVPETAARLEVDWWRIHREEQHGQPDVGPDCLTRAIARLYAHVYGVPEESVLLAAAERVAAMRISDDWVVAGCDSASAAVAEERSALVRSYAALLASVHRAPERCRLPA